MKADKALEWDRHPDPPTRLRAERTEFQGFLDRYEIKLSEHVEDVGWWVSGVGHDRRVDTVEEGQSICQGDYNRKRRLKAWEDYMLSHDPPEDS